MWSFVGSKSQQRWLWHAIDHHTGQVLAYVFGSREDHVFLELQALLKPFGITRFYTDGWGAYRRHIDPDQHTVGKQHTQKIERKHTTLRARIKRLVRKTICFSRSIQMHDLVIGLFINRFAYTYCLSSNNSAIVLLYQWLPTSIQCGKVIARRRKEDGWMGHIPWQSEAMGSLLLPCAPPGCS